MIATMALACATAMVAQDPSQELMLPTDPGTRIGKLPNGLTYYIRHNELPEHHAEFYIAQKVGSVLEEESQRGLAHFLEHMAFNGTKNFPGNYLREYLERNGVKFGANLNAYTSIDETVYNISDVPTDASHPGIVDTCLLILHDWSGCISLEGEEIDKERGVIHEEWRSRSSAQQRMQEKVIFPKLYGDNRYGHRMPIGLMEVVDNFKHEEIRNYYHTWYRPDLQGIFVVGDVDVDAVEASIKSMWSDIETPADAPARTEFKVEDFDEPRIAIASDKEMPYEIDYIMQKFDKRPAKMSQTNDGMMLDLVEHMAFQCLGERLEEMQQDPACPFMMASVSLGDYLIAKNDGALNIAFVPKEGKRQETMQMVLDATRTFLASGVTDAELERVKANILSSTETAYNERNKTKNRAYIREIQAHFIDEDEMMGIEQKYEVLQKILPMFNAMVVNQVMGQLHGGLLKDEKNLAMFIMAPEKEGLVIPTEEELLNSFRECMKAEIQGFVEVEIDKNIVDKEPKKLGKIKKSQAGPFGSTVWTLSNGVQVIWKQTDYKDDQILFSAKSFGGTDVYNNLTFGERGAMEDALSVGGLGKYSQSDLGKVLAGKEVSLNRSINLTGENLSGNSNQKDLRTLFQLIYVGATQPRADKELFYAQMDQSIQILRNREKDPSYVINDSLSHFRYGFSDKLGNMHSSDLENLDFDKLFKLGQERFANAADFRFYFIGNIDKDSLELLCRTYLANLPAKGKKEAKGATYHILSGSRNMRFEVEMKQPKTTNVSYTVLFNQQWNLKDDLATSMLGQVLRAKLTETIREQEGGTYSPSASASYDEQNGIISLAYSFETGAEKVDHLDAIAYEQVKKLANEGVDEVEFLKVRDYMVKRHAEMLKENSYWLNNMSSFYEEKFNFVDGYEEALNTMTASDLQNICKRLVEQGDRMKFVAVGIDQK